jgi:ribosomal protein L18
MPGHSKGYFTVKNQRVEKRLSRQKRVRKRVKGTTLRPRLSVFRSARHIYAQLIDDSTGKTLVSASTLAAPVKGELASLAKAPAPAVTETPQDAKPEGGTASDKPEAAASEAPASDGEKPAGEKPAKAAKAS